MQDHWLVYAPLLSSDFRWLASCAAKRGWREFSIIGLRARRDLGTDIDWSRSYTCKQVGGKPSFLLLVCGFSDDDIHACIETVSEQVPGGVDDDRPPTVWRVSQFPWDAAARIHGWSAGFRCNHDLAMAAKERGLGVQAIVSPAGLNDLTLWVAGHRDADVVLREATYLALDDRGRPPMREVGKIGSGGASVLNQIVKHKRIFDDAELPSLIGEPVAPAASTFLQRLLAKVKV